MGKNKFILFLILIAALVSLSNFTSVPGFWFDEGIAAGISKNIVEHGVYGTAVAPGQFETHNFWITINYPVTLPVALALKIFGVGVWQARLVPFIYLLLFIVTAYAIIRRLYGSGNARWMALLLITFSPLYGNGKAVLGEVPGMFWMLLGYWFYLRFLENKKISWLVWGAFAWGVAVSTKPFYTLLIPAVLFLLVSGLRSRRFNFRQALLAGGFFIIPLLVWLYFSLGLASFIDFKTSFSYLLNSYAADDFQQVIWRNMHRFISESTPLHFSFLSAIVVAAAWLKRKELRTVDSIVVSLTIFSVLAWFWYLKTPGWYRYFFSIHLLALMFFPAAAKIVLRRLAMPVIICLLIFQAIYSIKNYNKLHSTEAIDTTRYLESHVPNEASIFVASKPEIVFLISHPKMYQYIFVNKRLSIGANYLASQSADYVVAGRDPVADDIFEKDNAALLARDYLLDKEIGHYRIYVHHPQPLNK